MTTLPDFILEDEVLETSKVLGEASDELKAATTELQTTVTKLQQENELEIESLSLKEAYKALERAQEELEKMRYCSFFKGAADTYTAMGNRLAQIFSRTCIQTHLYWHYFKFTAFKNCFPIWPLFSIKAFEYQLYSKVYASSERVMNKLDSYNIKHIPLRATFC